MPSESSQRATDPFVSDVRNTQSSAVKTIHVVVLATDQGRVMGAFSTLEKASAYVAEHPYNAYIIVQRTVDAVEGKVEVK